MSMNIGSTSFGSVTELAKAIAGVEAKKQSNSEYFACGGCHREFFSAEEYNAHVCRGGRRPGQDERTRTTNALRQGVISNLPGGNASAVAEAIANKAEYMADVLKASSDSQNGGIAVDARLTAIKEVTEMKEEMIRAGIPCNTMNSEDTRKAYAEFKAAKSSPENMPDDDNLGKGVEHSAPSKRRASLNGTASATRRVRAPRGERE